MAACEPPIAIRDAIICIDAKNSVVDVLSAPDDARQRDQYPLVFGACDPYWSEASAEQIIGDLLLEIWHATVLLHVNPHIIHARLKRIPEYAAILG